MADLKRSAKMKNLPVICCVVMAGCMSHREPIVVPPVHVSVDVAPPTPSSGENLIIAAIAKSGFGPKTAVGQMAIGCWHFKEQNGRWPRTKDEVASGLMSANLSPAKLDHIDELRLHEEGAALVIDFLSTENGRIKGNVTLAPQMPNQPSEPTRTCALSFRKVRPMPNTNRRVAHL